MSRVLQDSLRVPKVTLLCPFKGSNNRIHRVVLKNKGIYEALELRDGAVSCHSRRFMTFLISTGAVSCAARAGGKGPSIWDTFTHKYPEKKIKDVSNGDVLDDSYHRYKEDIGIMKYMNLDAYRFSISWSRVLPKGKLSAGVNHEGVNYYNNLINELMANGLQPYVSLFHWDVPQALEDEYGGFLSPHIVVKHWITLNEPRSVSKNGYANGRFAPGRCSDWLKLNCTGEKSDRDAARRGLDFMFGWYMDPLTKGEYTKTMRSMLGNRLPEFSKEEARQLKGSFDFLGLNYYSSFYAAYAPHQPYMKTYCNACDRKLEEIDIQPLKVVETESTVQAPSKRTEGEDLLDDLETEDRRDKCCEAYSGDSVYELNEVAAAKGCLGHFPRGEMMGIIKKFINLDAGTD
ncbi:hypothetical protein JHK86_033440 [Glycine max]|nr:hypothetical protein JHK86_033440 [Glycine max]